MRDSPIRQIMLLRHDYVHRIGRKVAMLLRIWRFAAIYLTAPTLSLTFCHLQRDAPLPANWTDARRQWECGHAASVAVDLLGFGALMLAVVVDTPRSA